MYIYIYTPIYIYYIILLGAFMSTFGTDLQSSLHRPRWTISAAARLAGRPWTSTRHWRSRHLSRAWGSPKWWVSHGKSQRKMDDDLGVFPIYGNHHDYSMYIISDDIPYVYYCIFHDIHWYSIYMRCRRWTSWSFPQCALGLPRIAPFVRSFAAATGDLVLGKIDPLSWPRQAINSWA